MKTNQEIRNEITAMFKINYESEEIFNPFNELVRMSIENLIICSCAMEISSKDEKSINESLTNLVKCLEE